MFSELFATLNQSKYFSGLIMVLLNLGSKYVSFELSGAQEQFLNHHVTRKLLVFTIFFIATKDVFVSLVMTLIFIILVLGIFHEDSKICIAKNSLKNFCNKRKAEVSLEDYKKAKKIVEDYHMKYQAELQLQQQQVPLHAQKQARL